MSTSSTSKNFHLYQLFKYAVYCLLSYNVYVFYQDDLLASVYTFAEGISFAQFIQAFSATIDTAAWVLLLLIFELETYVIPDERIKGTVKWGLHGLRGLCYLLIVYAFYGYVSRFLLIFSAVPVAISDVCNLADSSFSYIQTLDEYIPVNASNCLQLANQSLFQLTGTDIISDGAHLDLAKRLVTADVVNAADWLLVVLILEIDVWLQLKGKLQGALVTASTFIKAFLYVSLFVIAGYWGYEGGFIDFWDATLWLVAFIFIEMNLIQWHEEAEAVGQGAYCS